ncbi:hypothetical protein ARMSODRAFT_1026844 [Armillaria solidipes]|uniref:Uncharacterized protein n=1 Tax=Armillaria solidipes TaxID=1076256 RepID=A0A2H3AZE7_9AGAR|nr:hypothetical protein ARMSODRAFT_1026844 [Armillaria solidipes]
MSPEAFLLDELLGDDVAGAKEEGCGAALGEHRPTDEERAVIGLVDGCKKTEEDRRGAPQIGPLFLRRRHFGPGPELVRLSFHASASTTTDMYFSLRASHYQPQAGSLHLVTLLRHSSISSRQVFKFQPSCQRR